MSLNTTTLSGIIKNVQPIKKLESGPTVWKFTLGVDDSYLNKDKQRVEREFSIDVEIWGKLCEEHVATIVAGAQIVVVGKIKLDAWTDATGVKKYKHSVIASQLIGMSSTADQETEILKQRIEKEAVLYQENPF